MDVDLLRKRSRQAEEERERERERRERRRRKRRAAGSKEKKKNKESKSGSCGGRLVPVGKLVSARRPEPFVDRRKVPTLVGENGGRIFCDPIFPECRQPPWASPRFRRKM